MCRWFAYVSPSEECLLEDVLIGKFTSLKLEDSKSNNVLQHPLTACRSKSINITCRSFSHATPPFMRNPLQKLRSPPETAYSISMALEWHGTLLRHPYSHTLTPVTTSPLPRDQYCTLASTKPPSRPYTTQTFAPSALRRHLLAFSVILELRHRRLSSL